MKRIIIDSNLLIKKINKESSPVNKIVKLCLAGQYQPILSHKILKDCVNLLGELNIDSKWQDLLEDFFAVSEIIKADFELNEVKKDAASNRYIECALASQADYLITENKHLLKLQKYLRTEIITPKDFFKLPKI